MKKFIILPLLLLSSVLFLTCQKDEIEETTENLEVINTETLPSSTEQIVTPRSGFVDRIFYIKSLTTDNYLLSQTPNYFRTYNLYNKTKIDSITFSATGKGLINTGGILLKHYNVSIYFKSKRTPHVFTAFSKSSSDKFTHIPSSSDQLLTSDNTAEIMTFEIQKSASTSYNYWSGKPAVFNFVKISKDGNRVDLRVLQPLNKNSNVFILPHSH